VPFPFVAPFLFSGAPTRSVVPFKFSGALPVRGAPNVQWRP